MMKRLNFSFLVFLLVVLLTQLPIGASAQPGDPAGGKDPDVPITGIEILIGIGSLFGAKKIVESRKKK